MDSQHRNRPPTVHSRLDLEIKDAQLIFESVWQELILRFGKDKLLFPIEIIWLGGAPGSGKGTNTPFILETRDITAQPIVVSKLLNTEEAKKVKNAGGMVGDREVISILLGELLRPEYRSGVVVDGFPRTKVQVECLKLFYNEMIRLREEFRGSGYENLFKQPLFHLVVLFVDEKISVERQLKRGVDVRRHNRQVLESGVGELVEERETDYSEEKARKRYRVFKESTYEALKSLREIFHYHFIDASGNLSDVQKSIFREFEYQSSLELTQATFDRIRKIPLASRIAQHARQELVNRLESYENDHQDLFGKVVTLIENKFIPVIRRHAISGTAVINSEDPTLDHSLALAMLIDIFSERGYRVVIDIHKIDIPTKIDPKTYQIECVQKRVYRIQIRFTGSQIRRGLT